MKKIFLFILLAVWPVLSMGRINFAALVLEGETDLFWFRNDAKLRRALLVTNGKEWFIGHILKPRKFSTLEKLVFIQGNYFVYEPQKRGDEFAAGLKKAIDYLSANNDTLYQIDRGYDDVYSALADPVFKKTISKSVSVSWTIPQMSDLKYNFDRFDFNFQNMPMITIYWNYSICNINSVDDYIFKTIFPRDVTPKIILNLWNDIHKPDTDLPDEKTERLYQLFNSFDDYVLSLPFTLRPYQLELLEWGYTPGKHLRPGDVPDFMKEEGIVEK